MNTDDLKYELQEAWDKFIVWLNKITLIIKIYFKNLDKYEYIGWGVNGLALILILIAFI